MAFVLSDFNHREDFYPITLNKAIASIEIGTSSLIDWWQFLLKEEVFIHTADYLQKLYKTLPTHDSILIDARVIPDSEAISLIKNLHPGQRLYDSKGTIAVNNKSFTDWTTEVMAPEQIRIRSSRDIINSNAEVMQMQFQNLATEKKFAFAPNHIFLTGSREQLMIEEGAVVRNIFVNTVDGPVYIAARANVQDGAMLRGPLFVGATAVIKMGAKIYGGSSIMAAATAGGEIKNSILMQYSNKAHDGYLGDSVIGNWCNLGAGTTNSNIKNTASESAFSHAKSKQLKAGVLMGDFCRTAIQTRINTGSAFGVSCNIVSENWPPDSMKSFSWFQNEISIYRFEKAIEHINNWMKLKGRQLTNEEEGVLNYIFDRLTND